MKNLLTTPGARRASALAASAVLAVSLLASCSNEDTESSAEASSSSPSSSTAMTSNDGASSSTESGTPGGPTIEVNGQPVDSLTDGDVLNVTVTGLDPQMGYYAAICAAEPNPASPVPNCTGNRGDQNVQQWISNDPAATTQLADDGSAQFDLAVAKTGEGVDCGQQECVLKLFGDHTEGFENVADLPVTFAN